MTVISLLVYHSIHQFLFGFLLFSTHFLHIYFFHPSLYCTINYFYKRPPLSLLLPFPFCILLFLFLFPPYCYVFPPFPWSPLSSFVHIRVLQKAMERLAWCAFVWGAALSSVCECRFHVNCSVRRAMEVSPVLRRECLPVAFVSNPVNLEWSHYHTHNTRYCYIPPLHHYHHHHHSVYEISSLWTKVVQKKQRKAIFS